MNFKQKASLNIMAQKQNLDHKMNTETQNLTLQQKCPKEKQLQMDNKEEKQKQKFIARSIINYHGTHIPIIYQQRYKFRQKWQNQLNGSIEKEQNLLTSASTTIHICSLLVMVHRLSFIWHLSVYRMFGLDSWRVHLVVGIFFILGDICLKYYLWFTQLKKLNKNNEVSLLNNLNRLFNLCWSDIFNLTIILILLLTHSNALNGLILLDLTMLILHCTRFSQIYQQLSLIFVNQRYRNHFNIANFICKIIVLLHVFAIILYSTTFTSNINWLTNFNQKTEDWVTRYVISIYFASTTLLTVGYGDIVPKNHIEYVAIIITQIVGTAIHTIGIITVGYIISEIGHTLSTLRRSREQFQQDLVNAEKISNYYALNEQLRKRVRNYVINHQIVNNQLNNEDQGKFLNKLDEDLRKQIEHQNHLRIIKTSLFFIYNWTKSLHLEISRKLQKIVISPNLNLVPRDRLYIVAKGAFNLSVERAVERKLNRRFHVHWIQNNPKKEVHQNVFGYTPFFTGRPSLLTAISNNFTIVYGIYFEELYNSVKNDARDFQYYHRVRTQLEGQRFPDKLEVPSLVNNRHHYRPYIPFVIKKYLKNTKANHRNNFKRNLKRTNIKIIDNDYQNYTTTEMTDADHENTERSQVLDNEQQKTIQPNFQKKVYFSEHLQRLNSEQHDFIAHRSYRRKNERKIRNEQKSSKAQSLNIVQTSHFEIGKEYQRYFPKKNKSAVLSKFQESKTQSTIYRMFSKMSCFSQNLDTFFINQSSNIRLFTTL